MTDKNTERIKRVRNLIKGYCEEHRDLKANAIDVLSDLRHLCDREDLDFHKLCDTSYQHYLAEKQNIHA